MPVPKGYTLDQPSTTAPAPRVPAGYTLDAPESSVAGASGPLPGVPGIQKPELKPVAASGPEAGSFGDTVSNIGTHLKNMVAAPYHAFTDPRQADEPKMTPFETPVQLGLKRMFVKPTMDALQESSQLRQAGGPQSSLLAPSTYDDKGQNIPTAGSKLVDAIPIYGPWARNVENESRQKGVIPAAAGLATDLAPSAVGEIFKAGAGAKVAEGMRDTGGGVMNRTVGSLQKDFRRGADPGRAYLDAGGGPAVSMDSLAGKGAALKDATGAKLGSLYDSATNNGVTIPSNKVQSAIAQPIQNARAVISGPGGTGNLAPIDSFADSFRSALSPPDLTPNDVFGIKKNVAANTNWSDPTQFGMKKLQQQTTGALSGVLTDAIPETTPLNSQYQGLTNFTNRANLRSQTGSSPLSSLFGRAAMGAGGAALGATHSPLTATLMGLGGLAFDSVPAKSLRAVSLYRAAAIPEAIGNLPKSVVVPPHPFTPPKRRQ